MVISQILKELENKLDRIEIFLILEYVLDKSKSEILTNLDYKIKESEKEKIYEIVKRRLNSEPLQYITHNQYFYGNKFYVNENVLIPRADTEVLVEEVLKIAGVEDNILDLCTGSGCIAVSLKKANQKLSITASDISSGALTIAMINSKINNVDIDFIKSDLFNNVRQKFNIIVSNPPYIKTKEIESLQKEVKKEPKLALDGGNNGLEYYEKIIKNAKDYLTDCGVIALEIGYNQAEEIRKILEENNFKDIKIVKDYGNNDRVVIAKTISE
ncbi:MAG: peptide chain release factor N(5)-glutamine methyltransferase [Clostridiales bacterium]|nr:peptide chain release factor N(5)-glutamine methyltransferase [Clostridiales bacterium]